MKYSNTALKTLSARYGKVLRKCAYLNAIVLTAAMIANPAMAEIKTVSGNGTPTSTKYGEQNIDGGRIWLKGFEKGTYTYDNVNHTLDLSPDNGEIKLSSISASIQTTNAEHKYPTVRINGNENTTLNITTPAGDEVSIFSRFAPLYVGSKDSPIGTINITNNDPGFSAIYVTSKNNNVNAQNQDLQMYGNNISITSQNNGTAITGNEGKLTLVANEKLDITGDINGYNKVYGGHADLTFNINQNAGNTAITTIKGNINAAQGSAVNIGLKGAGSSITGNLLVSADGTTLPGGEINLGFGTGGSITGNMTAQDEGHISISGDDLVAVNGNISIDVKSSLTASNISHNSGTIANNGTLTLGNNIVLTEGVTGTGSVVFNEGSTLKTALNNSTSLISGNTVTGTTSLVIDNGTTNATLNMFDASQSGFTFANNTLYDIIEDTTTAGTYNISKKSTEAITESLTSAGADTTTAQTVAAVTEAQPTTPAAAAIVEAITTAAQSGDIATVAEITEKINPTTTPVVQQQSVAMANQIFNVAGNRMGGIGRSGGDIDVTVGPWIQGLYNKTHNSQGVGFDGYSQGFAVGLDADINEHSLIGFGYGYTATDVKSNGRKTQIYSDNIFLYGKYQPNKWYVSGIANYGHSNYKEAALGLTSKYNVDTYSAAATVGYQEGIFDNYAGLRYSYITPDSYSNGLTTVEGKNAQVGTAVIGTKISKAYKTDGAVWKPEVRLAATYDIKSDNSSSIVGIVGGSSTYMVEGKRQKRFAVEAGVGLTTTVARNLDITLNYDANLRSKQTSQTGAVKLKYSF